MVAKENIIYRWILLYDKAYFISVHLFVYYTSVNIS